MPWPPVIPPATRANATPSIDTHPSDHNAISQALTDLVARVNPTAWAGFAFAAGWQNSGGIWQPCSIRLVGDIVQVKGQATHPGTGAVSGGTIATIPAGFRPSAAVEYACNGSAGMWAISCTAAGNLAVAFTTATGNVFVDLSGLWWSTT